MEVLQRGLIGYLVQEYNINSSPMISICSYLFSTRMLVTRYCGEGAESRGLRGVGELI